MNEVGRFGERNLRALADLLDGAEPPWRAGVVPPLGHWLAFPPQARQSSLGVDGHPLRIEHPDLPRRMWAGSRIRFLSDTAIDAPLLRRTDILSQTEKIGRSGRMVFVTLRHEIACDGTATIVEEQDIVYRALPIVEGSPRTIATLPYRADDTMVVPDPAMLFRFSALTYNAHRIHYDLPYAREVEGYPGLVVHAPLVATVLMDRLLRRRPGEVPSTFDFRAVAPLFGGERVTLDIALAGEQAILTASGPQGVAMTAQAHFHP